MRKGVIQMAMDVDIGAIERRATRNDDILTRAYKKYGVTGSPQDDNPAQAKARAKAKAEANRNIKRADSRSNKSKGNKKSGNKSSKG